MEKSKMEFDGKTVIRYVKKEDADTVLANVGRLPIDAFEIKTDDNRIYVMLSDNIPVGVLRYNVLWNNTPFCMLLYVDGNFRNRGYGKNLTEHWESEMRSAGYERVLVSTRVDETAQNFYRKLGYLDCGGLTFTDQPMELFLQKLL